MFSTTLSATTWYADVALLLLLIGFITLGVVKGFSKSMKGFFMAVTVVFVSLLISGLLHDVVFNSDLGQSLYNSIAEKSAGWGPEFNEIVHLEGETKFVLVDGVRQNLTEMSFKGKIADVLADMLITEYGVQSLVGLCVHNVTNLIVSVCLFAVSCIVLFIVCSIIKGITQGMHDSDSKGVRITNRVLGGLVGLVVGTVSIMIVFAILQVTGDKIPVVIDYINQSAVCKFFYDLNPIGKVLASIFAKQ